MKSINGRLEEYKENEYRINHKRSFERMGQILVEDVDACVEFAYEMAFGKGWHRVSRSGGDKKRNRNEVFINTFQGKVAEYALYRYLIEKRIEVSPPDMSIEGYGVWDSFDLEYGGARLAVKSTKYKGNLLLLETKDWNENGEYIPNIEGDICKYDFIVLLRLFPDAVFKIKSVLSSYGNGEVKKILKDKIRTVKWEYDIAGFITNKDLVRLIRKGYILPKNAMLNGTTQMDAENYYVQAGDMRKASELPVHMYRYKQRVGEMISRRSIL